MTIKYPGKHTITILENEISIPIEIPVEMVNNLRQNRDIALVTRNNCILSIIYDTAFNEITILKDVETMKIKMVKVKAKC